jgi:NADH-ubiquinone oxidoreductase chain 5
MGIVLFLGGCVILILGLNILVCVKFLFIEWVVFRLSGGVNLELIVLVDSTISLFIGLVLFISSIVLVYRGDYIGSDLFFYRFILLVNLFVASIVLMVVSPNLIRILLG